MKSRESATVASLSPFALEPISVERIWGVTDLRPWLAQPAGDKPIGEIWLTAETCKVSAGPLKDRTLAEVTVQHARELGDPQGNGFPLLIKLLFPREKLSVQVHPNDAEAQALGMPRGKTECWYVLSAEAGAQVAVGFRETLTPAEIRKTIEDGSIEDKLRMIPVKAGDMVFVDAGTVHAIGPGMVVLETQQYSDTTYRLWDYGRPRELHIEAGAAVTRTETQAGLVAAQPMQGFTRLVTSAYFAVDRFALGEGVNATLGEQEHMQILIALAEGCALMVDGGRPTPLPKGKAVVLPAGGAGASLTGGGGAEVIRVLHP